MTAAHDTPIGALSRLTTAAGLLASAALGAVAMILAGWQLRRRRQQTVLIIEVVGKLVNGGVQGVLRGESDDNTNPERRVRPCA